MMRKKRFGIITAALMMGAAGVYADAFNDLRYTFSASTGNQLAALGGPSSGNLTSSDMI